MRRTFLFRFFALFLVCILFSQVAFPLHTVYAGRSGDSREFPEYYDNVDESLESEEELEKPGFVEKYVLQLLTSLIQQLELLLNKAGISFGNIVFGRMSSNGTALFTFDLKPGNAYGLVGAALYQIFRMISYAIIGAIVVSKLSFKSFVKMTPQNLDKTKGTVMYLMLSFLLLALMPYLLDVVLYLRDALLKMVSTQASTMLFGRSGMSFSITDELRSEAGERLLGVVVYLASIFYMMYLAFLYAGYAMSFLVCFASFPLVVIASNLKQDLLKNWVTTVSYFVLVPVVDAALLLIPTYMVSSHVSGIIVLFTCMCMTQARSILSQLLGVQDRAGASMLGFAAMLAAGRLVNTAVKTGKTAVGLLAGASSDASMANYEGDMAAASGETTGGLPANSTESLDARAAGIESVPQRRTMASADMNVSSGTSVDANVSSGGTDSDIEKESIVNTSSQTDDLVMTRQRYTDIADNYATVDNFESGPLNSQISHAKKAQLYRERANQRRKQALGVLTGGAIGGLAGAGAGLMMGPATTSMFAAAGMDGGAQIGSAVASHIPSLGELGKNLGRTMASFSTMHTTAYDNSDAGEITTLGTYLAGTASEKVVGDVIGIPQPSTAVAVTASSSMTANSTSIPLGIDSVAQKDVNAHITANAIPIMESCRRLNDYYTDNAQLVMEPIYKEMEANKEFDRLDKERARELFRNRIYSQYMNEFNQLYDNHPVRVTSDDLLLENASKSAISSEIRKQCFDGANTASFVSDQALDNYSWFDL